MLNIPFSEKDLLLIYTEFQKKVNLATQLKNDPKNPIAASTIRTELKIYSSITEKIEEAYPKIKEMKPFFK